MDKTNRAVVAVIVAAIVFSLSLWLGGIGIPPLEEYLYGLRYREECNTRGWADDGYTRVAPNWCHAYYDVYETAQLICCVGCPAWAAIAGGFTFWLLGRGRDD